ncbi:hypothetical protein HUN08_15190 [Gordonia sp. X0973]|uniref:Clp protease N-terminal domain-containing protein n=1 Tax=Gordonia sp. X0973 TaxID=2742602 RepID=UPI0013EE185F|nr:Clp protease N-terminal domain-containing protein [Gordonia sp. X0973]QKT08389.1 hypothetical protein HUN08_15190 [Gordonia sp. X0973]
MAFPFAIAEAQDLGNSALGPEHLILGVLCNNRDPLVGVLAEHNITLESARDAVRGIDPSDEDESDSDEERYTADRDALKMLGIDLDKVRDAVAKNFGDDLSSGWGRRDPRGRGRRGGPHNHDREHRGGPHGRRGGPHGRGGPREWGGDPRDFAGRGPWGPGFDPRDFDRGEFDPFAFAGAEGPWDHGRGRRGPRGRRARFSRAAKDTVAGARFLSSEDGGRTIETGHVILAAFRVGTPPVRAIMALAPDEKALIDAVAAQLSSGASA